MWSDQKAGSKFKRKTEVFRLLNTELIMSGCTQVTHMCCIMLSNLIASKLRLPQNRTELKTGELHFNILVVVSEQTRDVA